MTDALPAGLPGRGAASALEPAGNTTAASPRMSAEQTGQFVTEQHASPGPASASTMMAYVAGLPSSASGTGFSS